MDVGTRLGPYKRRASPGGRTYRSKAPALDARQQVSSAIFSGSDLQDAVRGRVHLELRGNARSFDDRGLSAASLLGATIVRPGHL